MRSKIKLLQCVAALGCLPISAFAQSAATVTGISGCVLQPSSTASIPGSGQFAAANSTTSVFSVNVATAQVTPCSVPQNFVTAPEINAALAATTVSNTNAVRYTTANGQPTAAVNLAGSSVLPAGTSAVSLTGVAAGQVNAVSTDAVNGAQVFGVQQAATAAQAAATSAQTLANTAQNTAANAQSAISILQNTAVKYATDANGAATNIVQLSGANTSQPVNVKNLATGTLASGSTDAVNGGQLYSIQQSAVVAQTSAAGAQAAAVAAQATAANAVQYLVFNGNPVAQIDLSRNTGLPASTRQVTVTGLAAGAIGSSSTDAVNGSQLYAVGQNLTGLQTRVANLVSPTIYNSVTPVVLSASGVNALASGGGASAAGDSSVAIGNNAVAQGKSSLAIGQNAKASGGTGAVSLGAGNIATGNGAVAIGDPTVATGTGATAIGANNSAIGQGAVALGNLSQAQGQSAVSLGDSAMANGASAIAIGQGASVSNPGGLALGANAVSTGLNSAAIGVASDDNGQSNVVSVGNATTQRKLVYLAPGNLVASSSDATNGGQLFAVAASTAAALGGGAAMNSVTGQVTAPAYVVGGASYADVGSAIAALNQQTASGQYVQVNGAGNGAAAQASGPGAVAVGQNAQATKANSVAIGTAAVSTGTNSVALGAGSTDGGLANVLSVGNAALQRRIVNVAAGNVSATSTDAVNGSQLYSTNQAVSSLSSSLNNLSSNFNKYKGVANRGIAGAMAMQGGQQIQPGHFAVGMGLGTFGGQTSMALRVGMLTPDGHWSLGGAVSTGVSDFKSFGGSVHADYQF